MKKTLQVLNQMVLDRVIDDYVIAGAVAAIYYTEPVDTEDLDLLVSFSGSSSLLLSLEPILKYLKEKGFSDFKKEGVLIEGIPVQFLPIHSPLSEEAFRNCSKIEISGESCKIVSLEYLMALMVECGRWKDRIRLEKCLQEAQPDLHLFEGILQKFSLFDRWEKWKKEMSHE